MTRTDRVLAQHWRGIASLFAFVALFGIAAILWARIDASDRRAADYAAEADLRGRAVSTLATDVRALRSQIKSEGKTPVAPDPSAAVSDLPDRAAVPVQIPGPKGDKGDKGDPGSPAPTITPSPGASGASGADGLPGRDGIDGAPGKDGQDGVDGQNGSPPSGWTYTDPDGNSYDCHPADNFDPDAPRYECTLTSSSSPGQSGQKEPQPSPQAPGLNLLALAAYRRY